MLVMGFLQWWYGPGWRDAARRLKGRLHQTYLTFSVPILARTLFAPWRRITAPPSSSLEQKGRAMVDNAISRAVGFTVRLFSLIAAIFVMAFYTIAGGMLLIAWPVLPLLGPILVVGGLIP